MPSDLYNQAQADTPQPGPGWLGMPEAERVDAVAGVLRAYPGAEDFLVVKAGDNGHVVVAIERNIPANERGLFLLGLERHLKEQIDAGLTLWCEPVGDKSKLRKLRGVVIKA